MIKYDWSPIILKGGASWHILSADIAPSTAKEWLKVLVGLDIIYLLAPYANNERKRLSKTPKLYFCDTRLCPLQIPHFSATINLSFKD